MRHTVAILLLAPVVLLPLLAAADPVTVSLGDCRWLTRHLPDEGVRYAPGKDVRGRDVAPADLHSGGRIELPDTITVDLEIPLRLLLEERTTDRLAEANVNAGTVSLDRATGTLSYNGRPLTQEFSAELAAACRELIPE